MCSCGLCLDAIHEIKDGEVYILEYMMPEADA